MLIYLTASDKELSNYTNYHNVPALSREVMDNEAREIICENFLSSFDYNDVPKLLEFIFNKIRLEGTLTIREPDFNLISRQFFREEVDTKLVNDIVFSENQILKCFLTLESVEQLVQADRFKVVSKEFDSHNFTLKIKRIA